MPIFRPFDVVAAPFPYVERPVVRRRPCLVIATPAHSNLVWVLMITSAVNARWPGDVMLRGLDQAGLKSPSVVRTAKIATIETDILKQIGHINPQDTEDVLAQLRDHLPSSIR
ncbi:type II toxin-antitoxin system PemK/MazF family toxin [Thalassospira sp.]|uniref:type II toxin-antitoxin system PemK/MazF family toxin n=1 Tax=Thalassospira sp. TaxID=1912094 RepID=UPI002735A1F2|nr:type II toxin-antitoxin system PemK/MazF family toxin [Thalassospira sp.]MDP2699584.1 type II toxin-antitoxin system PemK/MazF family toxin [Thalassospira sp.]